MKNKTKRKKSPVATGLEKGSVKEFFVASGGSDASSGTSEKPFATLDRARKAVRLSKRKNPSISVTVTIRCGVYSIEKGFELTSLDSGTVDAPVTYRAADGERVVITGGRRIGRFSVVKNKAVLDRLDKRVHGKVVQCNLKSFGITDYGDYEETSWTGSSGTRLELFFNDKPMTIARWPNKGFARVSDVVDPVKIEGGHGNHTGKFLFKSARLKKWVEEKDLRLHGYWFYDWAEQRMAVKDIDPKRKIITLENPETHSYGFRKNQRFFVFNALCELDSPGEWYLDRATGILYFYPPEPLKKSSAVVSMTTGPLVKMTDVSHVVFKGIVFEAGRSDGMAVSGGSDVRIIGCVFRNLGAWAVRINSGLRHGVVGCDIYETGEGGIAMAGGDRAKLSPSGHYVVNNNIHHYARWRRVYNPGVSMSGVGIRVANNKIHDAPHMAIYFGGNEHVIEFNEINNVVYETFDAGAVYCGRDPSMQGSVIRYNYFHHIGRIAEFHGATSVYFDDGHCGNTVFGNIFYKACMPGRCKFGAVFIHGGRYNNIENNVFIECGQVYNETPWDNKRWKKYWTTPPYKERVFGKSVDVTKKPYSDKYPWLPNILDDDRPNILARNIVYKCGAFNDCGVQKCVKNLLSGDPLFVDFEKGDFQLKDGSPAFRLGFKRIPAGRIGLIDDETRASWAVGAVGGGGEEVERLRRLEV